MAKTQRKRRNSEGKLKKVYRPSSTQKEKKHESQFQKFSAYSNRKAEEQQSKDMMARQAELDAMGMPVEQQEFGFEDHKALYNYAQASPIQSAPNQNYRRIRSTSRSHFVSRVSYCGVFVASGL